MPEDERPQGELDGLLSGYLRRKRREQVVPFFKSAKRILDIGCGVFVWADLIQPTQSYLGIDVEEEIVEYNRKNFGGLDCSVFNANTSNYGEIPGSFDLIIMLAVIEHVSSPQQALAELKSKLAPGGKLVLTTPAPWGDFVLDTGAKFGLFASDKHQHEKLLGKKDLVSIGQEAGLRLLTFKRFLYFQNQLAVYENRN